MNERWGIYIIEGPDYSAIGRVNLAVLVLSGLAAFLSNLFKDDFQGAFGFAGWIVAVVNGILFVYVVNWQQQ